MGFAPLAGDRVRSGFRPMPYDIRVNDGTRFEFRLPVARRQELAKLANASEIANAIALRDARTSPSDTGLPAWGGRTRTSYVFESSRLALSGP
jgi:hypothetical protein